MQDPIGFQDLDGLGEGAVAIEAEPGPGMPTPPDVKAIPAHSVELGEGRIELFARVFRESGAVALDEAIAAAEPFSAVT